MARNVIKLGVKPESVWRQLYRRLRLKVNVDKSAVAARRELADPLHRVAL